MIVVLLLLALPARAQVPEVDLKLFDKADVDLSRGCSVALWQANRDPAQDRFAYLFVEMLSGPAHARQPARMKIADQVVTLRRIATGGKTNGYDLDQYQLYKLPGEADYVVLDLRLGELEGEAVSVEKGSTVNVIMRGRQVFRAQVLGGAGCATPAAVPASRPAVAGALRRYDVKAPSRAVTAAARAKFECDPEFMASGITGFQLSEEAAVWEIPCQRFATQATAVYALVYLPDPGRQFQFLPFQEPKGHKRTGQPFTLISPEWDLGRRMVTSIAYGRGAGDCGVLERHRLGADGTFSLVEYREKARCDGKPAKPEEYPLVFRAQ